jgi:hypothetical protein
VRCENSSLPEGSVVVSRLALERSDPGPEKTVSRKNDEDQDWSWSVGEMSSSVRMSKITSLSTSVPTAMSSDRNVTRLG